MLLDTIKRHDVDRIIKLVSVEALKQTGKLPSVIHSVPALMLSDEKRLMFGKNVFDYLLLPGSGVLLKMQAKKIEDATSPNIPMGSGGLNPEAFTLTCGGLADMFSPYDDDGPAKLSDRLSTWTPIEDTTSPASPADAAPYQEETRQKISLPDIEYIRQQRDMDLRGGDIVINLNQIPPAAPTRLV
jgi:hypothetical protein